MNEYKIKEYKAYETEEIAGDMTLQAISGWRVISTYTSGTYNYDLYVVYEREKRK